MIVYFNGQYLLKEHVIISPDDRGFLFGDGIYEVILSYKGKLFRFREHINRLNSGANSLEFHTTDFYYLEDVANELIRQNNMTSSFATVYIQVTRGNAPRTHCFPNSETPLTVYVSVNLFNIKKLEEESFQGVNTLLVPDIRWARCDIKTVNLLGNVLANQKSKVSGTAEALFVRDGVVLEGTHTNLFAVVGGMVITNPKTNYVLSGITRQVVIDICKETSIPFEEKPIFESSIYTADEIMIVGTTTEIKPVVKINDQPIGNSMIGPITRKLQKCFQEIKN